LAESLLDDPPPAFSACLLGEDSPLDWASPASLLLLARDFGFTSVAPGSATEAGAVLRVRRRALGCSSTVLEVDDDDLAMGFSLNMEGVWRSRCVDGDAASFAEKDRRFRD
jgi:hypothetical protein